MKSILFILENKLEVFSARLILRKAEIIFIYRAQIRIMVEDDNLNFFIECYWPVVECSNEISSNKELVKITI